MPPGTRVFYHHLASRSPWRARGSAALQVPDRENLVALVIDELPRLHPFDLRRGADAIDIAYVKTRLALGRPVEAGAVRM
jgi:NTE family protein